MREDREIRRLAPAFAVTGQVRPEEMAEVAAMGFRSVVCNRPDDEEPGQPGFEAVHEAALRAGLRARAVPVSAKEGPSETDRRAFAEAIGTLPGPVLAYCRTGARSAKLWDGFAGDAGARG